MILARPSDGRIGAGRILPVIVVVAVIVVAGVIALLFVRGNSNTTTQTSGTTGTPGSVLISLGQTPRLLGPGTTMNYTLTLSPGVGADGNSTISVQQPQGLSVLINPSTVALVGNSIAVDFSIHASDSINPGDYMVGITVAWSKGSSNLVFHFTVVQHLVLLLGGSTGPGPFSPQSVSVHSGESVTWISLDAGSDEYGGLRSVKVVETNASSPTLTLFSRWAFTFASAGTYHIDDPLNPILVAQGTVAVV